MSLINQMLQELDARGNQAALGGVLQGQVRAVPQRRSMHPAWWLVLGLACLLGGGGLWIWLARTAPAVDKGVFAAPTASPVTDLSLKIDKVMDAPPEDFAAPRGETGAPAPTSSTSSLSAATERAAQSPPSASAITPTPMSPAKTSVSSADAMQQPGRAGMAAGPGEAAAIAKAAQPVKVPASLPVAPDATPAGEPSAIAKQVKELTPRQLAENEYRKASGLIPQGRAAEAISALEQALQLDSRHAEARQTLAALLIQSRRQDDAARTLREGLQLDVSQTGLAMILSRLQLERGELKPAIETLQRSLPHAGERADYLAFLAALLQRDGRHKDAIDHYAQALRKAPGNGLWLMGQGISLQAENRIPEAIEAYKRARAANNLSAELKAFVEERLNSL